MFPRKDWALLSDEERDYYSNLTEKQLIERWNSDEGKEIIAKIIAINLKFRNDHYKNFIGTVKTSLDGMAKFDMRGIQLERINNILDDTVYSFDFSNCDLSYAKINNSNLMTSTFKNADLLYGEFMNSSFMWCDFENANLTLARFNDSNLERANLKGTRISSVKFNNAKLGYVKYNNKTEFENIDTVSFNGSSNPLFIDFLNKKHFLKHFKSKSKSNKVVYYIWYIISDCGQSFSRWLLVSAILSFMYGLLFNFFDSSFLISSGRELTSFSYFYFSIVTFTTLGYGDISPKDLLGEILISTEVILGYIMLGGLLSIFSEKFIPRR